MDMDIDVAELATHGLPENAPEWMEQAFQEAYHEAERRVKAKKAKESQAPYVPYGGAKILWDFHGREVLISGPAGTGKTRCCLELIHHLCETHPRMRVLIVRKTRVSLSETALVTYEEKVLGLDHPMLSHQILRSHREAYAYPNRSLIVVGGMDKPQKVMSGEYDLIYAPEATELDERDWQAMITRMRNNRLGWHTIIGDCNPTTPDHWLYRRCLSGRCKMIVSTHKDNPTLWDEGKQEWTPSGRAYVFDTLGALTGIDRQRLLEGKWVHAEGIIFDGWLDAENEGNVSEVAEYDPRRGEVLWALDDGYSAGSAVMSKGVDPDTGFYVGDAHPRAILFCQFDERGVLNVFNESYACLKLSDDHIREALIMPYTPEQFEQLAMEFLRLRMDIRKPFAMALGEFRQFLDSMKSSEGRDWLPMLYPAPEWAVHGPGSAEIRGRLFSASIYPRALKASVSESIKELRRWVSPDKNGVRLVRVHPRCRQLRGEFPSYVYKEGGEHPEKAFDHGIDALRGLVWSSRHQND